MGHVQVTKVNLGRKQKLNDKKKNAHGLILTFLLF